MFPTTLLSSLALALSISTATVAALSAPAGGSRLAPNHRFVKRAAGQRERRRGFSGGHGGPHHGRKGGYHKSKASSSKAAATSSPASSSSSSSSSSAAKAYSSAAVEVNAAYAKATTTSSSKASTSSSTSSSSTYSGTATWYTQDGTTGACGTKYSDSDYVVALDSDLYGDMDAESSYCYKTVKITNTANSKTVTATVADACPGCSSKYSLDLSTGAFDQIGDEDTGELDIEWYFTD